MSLVFCTKAPEQLLNMNDEQFISHLQQQFGWRLGAFQAVSRRYSYPLMLKRATSFVGDRIALVGNAAQTLHPVAGQGFNLGIRDVFALAKIVAEADEIGSAAMLQQYQQQRLADQQHIIGLTDNLVQIFSNSLLPLQILRNLANWFKQLCFIAKSFCTTYFGKDLMKTFDIVVIGGGMVGLAFAQALKQSACSIAVIEANNSVFDLSNIGYQ